jgi:hypothetical protein
VSNRLRARRSRRRRRMIRVAWQLLIAALLVLAVFLAWQNWPV